MTKAEIVSKVAEEAEISKVAAEKAFEAVIGTITDAFKKGDKLSLVGFGTFSISSRKARKGVNPRTGEAIKIPAKKIPKFSAGATLKAMVNGKNAIAKPAKTTKTMKATKTAKAVVKPASPSTKAAKAAVAAKAVKGMKAVKPAKAGRAKKK